MSSEYLLFVFDSTHDAIRSNRLLAGLKVIVMPVLREISASCGMALRLDETRREEALSLLTRAGVSGWRLYRVRTQDREHLCQLVSRGDGAGD